MTALHNVQRRREPLTYREAALRAVIRRYKASARLRGIRWQLSDEEARFLLASACWYCGIGPQIVVKVPGATRSLERITLSEDDCFVCNGIDRAENDGPYSIANCRPCCKQCNVAKLNHSEYEYFEWIMRSYEHLKTKNVFDAFQH